MENLSRFQQNGRKRGGVAACYKEVTPGGGASSKIVFASSNQNSKIENQ
jgi:hypothetical protein